MTVSMAGWQGEQPRVYGRPDASVWTVMNPGGCSMFGARTQASGFGVAGDTDGGVEPQPAKISTDASDTVQARLPAVAIIESASPAFDLPCQSRNDSAASAFRLGTPAD
jgi:hypothetical protein